MNENNQFRQWFALGTRLFSLWLLFKALGNLHVASEIARQIVQTERTPIQVYYEAFARDAILGICLLFGADGLSRIVYRQSQLDAPDDFSKQHTGNIHQSD